MRYVYMGMFALGIAWLLALIGYGWVDMQLRRSHRHHLDTRAWREKVEAMRRMHDEEGDA